MENIKWEPERKNAKTKNVAEWNWKKAAAAADQAQLTYNLLVKWSRVISRDYF